MKFFLILLATVVAVLGYCDLATSRSPPPTPRRSRSRSVVDPHVKRLLAFGKVNIMITLANGTDAILAQLRNQHFADRAERLNAVAAALQAHAELTQGAVLEFLATFSAGIQFTSYWVSNQIFVRGASGILVAALEMLPAIGRIQAEFFVHLNTPYPSSRQRFHSLLSVGDGAKGAARQGGTNTWGVNKIRAPDVWNMGYTGQGVLVGSIDTGVRGTHQALSAQYIGQYGWFEPRGHAATPYDDLGHGTHTMGTIVGKGGIGVAPNARWMHCKACYSDGCSSNDLTACGQFIQCPTLPDGSNQDCSRAPWLVSNSWGGDAGGQNWYNSIINAWQTAWIIPVFSIGNDGPNCGTARSPGDQLNLIAVGNTDSTDSLAYDSSVGPTTDGRVKPDIAAPGSAVTSAYPTSDTSYAGMSGTSMACPHVAGTVALMQSKNPNLSYQDIYNALTSSADRTGLRARGLNCGGKSDSAFPNNSFGYGRLNALNAINSI